MKNPVTFFLFLAFALANVLDAITAMFIAPGESNPIYLIFGNFWILMIIKFGFVYVMYYYTKRNIFPSNFMYYLTIMILVLGGLLMSMGVWSNIYGMMHPEVIDAAAQMSAGEKARGYGLMITVIYIIPALFNIIMFKLYDKSISKAVIDKEFFRKLKWWKL